MTADPTSPIPELKSDPNQSVPSSGNNTSTSTEQVTPIFKPEPRPEAFTPKDAFKEIQEKLISKYGEEVTSSIAKDYNRVELLSSSGKQDYVDSIFEKAREVNAEIKANIERQEVYKSFDMDEKAGEQAIKKMLAEDQDFAEMVKEDQSLLNSKAFVRKTLKNYKEKMQGEANKLARFGVQSGQTYEDRLGALFQKKATDKKLPAQELKEYHSLLEQKYNTIN